MKQKNIQLEVLVPVETSFTQRVVIEHSGKNRDSNLAEELEKGFWNGLLNEIFPELVLPMHGSPSELFIWQISTSGASLLIDMAETPTIIIESYSINPCCFLSISKMN